jgi:NAD(P)-dependent dehydrogenase (short-subunit alcohol dehydrogenase family)
VTLPPINGARLVGRRAFVTGAAGGLGRAICTALVANGAAVALAGRRIAPLEALAEELSGAGGTTVLPVQLDVRDRDDVDGRVAEAGQTLGGLDLLVNAAAIDTGWARVGDMSPEVWHDTIAINLHGTFHVCQAALPLLIAARGGTIVNITSVAGHRAWALDAAYNASKAGVELLTRTLAVEYAKDGVRANCLAPGVIDGGLTDTVTDAAEREELTAMHPVGRMGKVEEVAEAVVWLSSDAASFTTGSTLGVDGGFLA